MSKGGARCPQRVGLGAALQSDFILCLRRQAPSRGGEPIHLQAQSFWNENSIEQIKTPLHEQREYSGGNRTLQNGQVIV